MTQDKPFLTAAEIAERWAVCEMTIRRMMSRGELGYIRLGRSIRITLSEVKAHEKMNRSLQMPKEPSFDYYLDQEVEEHMKEELEEEEEEGEDEEDG